VSAADDPDPGAGAGSRGRGGGHGGVRRPGRALVGGGPARARRPTSPPTSRSCCTWPTATATRATTASRTRPPSSGSAAPRLGHPGLPPPGRGGHPHLDAPPPDRGGPRQGHPTGVERRRRRPAGRPAQPDAPAPAALLPGDGHRAAGGARPVRGPWSLDRELALLRWRTWRWWPRCRCSPGGRPAASVPAAAAAARPRSACSGCRCSPTSAPRSTTTTCSRSSGRCWSRCWPAWCAATARCARRRPSGVVVGLALLTKAFAVVLPPHWWCGLPPRAARGRGGSWRDRLPALARPVGLTGGATPSSRVVVHRGAAAHRSLRALDRERALTADLAPPGFVAELGGFVEELSRGTSWCARGARSAGTRCGSPPGSPWPCTVVVAGWWRARSWPRSGLGGATRLQRAWFLLARRRSSAASCHSGVEHLRHLQQVPVHPGPLPVRRGHVGARARRHRWAPPRRGGRPRSRSPWRRSRAAGRGAAPALVGWWGGPGSGRAARCGRWWRGAGGPARWSGCGAARRRGGRQLAWRRRAGGGASANPGRGRRPSSVGHRMTDSEAPPVEPTTEPSAGEPTGVEPEVARPPRSRLARLKRRGPVGRPSRLSRPASSPPAPGCGRRSCCAVWEMPWRLPIDTRSDATLISMMVKNIEENGWYYSQPRLGAPFGQQFYDFPHGGETFQLFAMKIIVWLTGDWGLAINLYFFLGFGVLAAVTFLVCATSASGRSLRASPRWCSRSCPTTSPTDRCTCGAAPTTRRPWRRCCWCGPRSGASAS
jgi:hypothetical protein